MILLLDNYDSFTYNLKDYLEQIGQDVQVVRNDEQSVAQMLSGKPEGIVISPGPGRPENAGHCMDLLDEVKGSIPILGICLGMQAIGLLYGAKLIRSAYPMHGKVSRIQTQDHPLFDGMPDQIEVCRYHSLVLDEIYQTELNVLAQTEVGEIMALEHKEDGMTGLQFHPEAILTQFGLEMLANWAKGINLHKQNSSN